MSEEHEADAAIAAVTEAVNRLHHYLPTGEELLTRVPDWAVRVRAAETVLANWRRTAEKSALEESGGRRIEAEDGSVLVDVPKYKWKFNVQRILVDVSKAMGEGGGFVNAILFLQREGALTLGFKVTKLRSVLSGLVELEERKGSKGWEGLDDLDGPHAGRQVTGYTSTRMSAEEAESKAQFMGGTK